MVDPDRIGIMGHSLGGEMAYTIAVSDPSIKAVAFSGFGYRDDADTRTPRNMLMIFGKYDEYRKRMTATADFERDFMTSPRTLAVFPVSHPEFDRTYGSFADGTARRVHMTRTTHVMESHSEDAVAEACWMRDSLGPDPVSG
jgi:dienelactone hydrolase